MDTIIMRRGESKIITFTITDEETGDPIDVSTTTVTFKVKKSTLSTNAVITKEDTDFDKSNANEGLLHIEIMEVDTQGVEEADYTGELKIVFDDGSIDKSQEIMLIIEQPIND